MRIAAIRARHAAAQCKTAAAGSGGRRWPSPDAAPLSMRRCGKNTAPQCIDSCVRRSSMPYVMAATTPNSRFASSGPEPRSEANHGNTTVMP